MHPVQCTIETDPANVHIYSKERERRGCPPCNGDSDWATFLSEMQENATVEAEGMGMLLATGGDADSSVATALGRTTVYYQMSVSDPAEYASTWSEFISAKADTGVISYLSSVLAFGSNPSTHVVSDVYSFPGEALANDATSHEGWASFSERVSDIRTVEGRAITTVIAERTPE